MRLRVGDALIVVSTKTGADMGHDRMVTRLYSLRKPAPNVAAFGRAGEGHSLALILIGIPRMPYKGKAPIRPRSTWADKTQVREATGVDSE